MPRLRRVETSPCHHRRPRRSVPVRGRPHLRRLPGPGSAGSWPATAAEGEAAFEPRSRAPKTSPGATPAATVELVLRLRKQLDRGRPGRRRGHDRLAPDTTTTTSTLSRATINRILIRAGHGHPGPVEAAEVAPTSGSRPSSPTRPGSPTSPTTGSPAPTARPGADVEIITWLDDHSRYALHVTAHARITAPIVLATFREAADLHGYPASTLTDNGMVYTVRFAGQRRQAAATASRPSYADSDIVQKNSRPNHPTTCGKVERFQQTLKKWLRAQPAQPTTIAELQTLLDALRRRVQPPPPAPVPAAPGHPGHRLPRPPQGHPRQPTATSDTHDRVRHDKIRQGRHRHPARRRPATPHRHRPNLRRNLRPPARPGPRRPRRRRRHRRAPPRAHHRPPTRLPAHRHDHPANPANEPARTYDP